MAHVGLPPRQALRFQELEELAREARSKLKHPAGVGDETMNLNPAGVLSLVEELLGRRLADRAAGAA